MKILGNHGPGMFPIRTGSGVDPRKVPFGYVYISMETNEEMFLPAADLFPHPNQRYQGVSAQTLLGSFKIDVTLAPADLALNPTQHPTGMWIQEVAALAPGTIMKLVNTGTVLRITCVAKGLIAVAGV